MYVLSSRCYDLLQQYTQKSTLIYLQIIFIRLKHFLFLLQVLSIITLLKIFDENSF